MFIFFTVINHFYRDTPLKKVFFFIANEIPILKQNKMETLQIALPDRFLGWLIGKNRKHEFFLNNLIKKELRLSYNPIIIEKQCIVLQWNTEDPQALKQDIYTMVLSELRNLPEDLQLDMNQVPTQLPEQPTLDWVPFCGSNERKRRYERMERVDYRPPAKKPAYQSPPFARDLLDAVIGYNNSTIPIQGLIMTEIKQDRNNKQLAYLLKEADAVEVAQSEMRHATLEYEKKLNNFLFHCKNIVL
jgi:hypothetical protein